VIDMTIAAGANTLVESVRQEVQKSVVHFLSVRPEHALRSIVDLDVLRTWQRLGEVGSMGRMLVAAPCTMRAARQSCACHRSSFLHLHSYCCIQRGQASTFTGAHDPCELRPVHESDCASGLDALFI
jgi:hypothetical protein